MKVVAARARWTDVLARVSITRHWLIAASQVTTRLLSELWLLEWSLESMCVFRAYMFISGKTLPLNFRHPTQHADAVWLCLWSFLTAFTVGYKTLRYYLKQASILQNKKANISTYPFRFPHVLTPGCVL